MATLKPSWGQAVRRLSSYLENPSGSALGRRTVRKIEAEYTTGVGLQERMDSSGHA
jgi:hypothetical protein